MQTFTFARTPQIYFGLGKFKEVPRIVGEFGSRVLIVTGASSYALSPHGNVLTEGLKSRKISYVSISVKGEPSPNLIDDITSQYREKVDIVLAVGGGSAIDTGKAVSAMLLQDSSVRNYLEGFEIGPPHSGVKVPFIAVPTTAGTGSEATKNAVLSEVGPRGFKKSLRHDHFIPNVAVVDPELTASCPPHITAACGMDAFTQLLEAYVSSKATAITDALALNGIEYLKDALILAYKDGRDMEARARMAYASLLSGIALANAGLGIVHGFASSLGGLFPIPHGVICGTLVGAATEVNIKYLKAKGESGKAHLLKYARIGALLCSNRVENEEEGLEMLLEQIRKWLEILELPRLSRSGIEASDLERIAMGTENKNNPIPLTSDQMKEILQARL